MIQIIQVLHPFLISWFLTEFEPIHWTLEKIDKIKKPDLIDIVWTISILPFSCLKCMGFWMGLIMSGDLHTAILTSIIGYLYGIIVEKIKWINF